MLALTLTLAVAACTGDDGGIDQSRVPPEYRVAQDYAAALRVDLSAMERRSTNMFVDDITVGDGARADSGDIVTVHYTGWLPTGTEFDSSRDGDPFSAPLGYGRVIDGWDQGVVGMHVGGRRRLVIPPALGYGARGQGPIPSNATLVFDIELLDVENRVPEGGAAADADADSAETGG
ncbi:MAG: FKBP-type peptidyl-prolyl cis-trans isomerase [Gemmatimonadota bacterium]